MTLIVGANFIEGPLLASDSRSTARKTKNASDTATKIMPLNSHLMVGICGNPRQAIEILRAIFDHNRKFPDHDVLRPGYLLKNINKIAEDVLPIDINDSRCTLIFAGIDKNNNSQIIHTDKIKEYFDKANNAFDDGTEYPATLTLAVVTGQIKGYLEFNYPHSYLFTYSFPSAEVAETKLLEYGSWGSGASAFKKVFDKEFHQFWGVNDVFPKNIIFPLMIKDLIDKTGDSIFIGGLPQVASIDKNNGVVFHGFSKNNLNGEAEIIMKFEDGVWHQINNKTGKVIKTLPNLFDRPSFNPEEVVDFISEVNK
jgi:hypothetical protein